jgi:ketosteroid isomerase-like protein
LAAYLAGARSIVAVDIDGQALERFAATLNALGAKAIHQCIQGPLEAWDGRADLAVFEFCLHEMPDLGVALDHARCRAAEVIVADHHPGSVWARCTGEGEKVERAWRAAEARRPSAVEVVDAVQEFQDYDALEARVASQGEPALAYIQRYRGCTDLRIPMRWAMALFPGEPAERAGKENG